MIFKFLKSSKEKLFVKLAIFQLAILMLFVICFSEIFLRKVIKSSDHVYQRSLLYKKKKSPNTIWGDSSSMQSISFMNGYLNFSGPSDNYQEIEKKIRHYYKKFDSGKVILNLSLNGFSEYRDVDIRQYELDLYLQTREPILLITNKRYQDRLVKYLKSYIENRFSLSSKYFFNSDGSLSTNSIYDPPLNKDINKNHKYYPKKDFRYDRNYKAFLGIIDFLMSKNIEICLISSPWQKDFREKRLDMKKFNSIRNFYADFSNKKDIKYFDFTAYPFVNNFFDDGSHLNSNGAKKFTSLVQKSCNI